MIYWIIYSDGSYSSSKHLRRNRQLAVEIGIVAIVRGTKFQARQRCYEIFHS